jgi:hypothetical protein
VLKDLRWKISNMLVKYIRKLTAKQGVVARLVGMLEC